MNYWLQLILLFSLPSTFVYAQTLQNPISILRYNDNFEFVKSDSVKKGIHQLKHIPLSDAMDISFGGEWREQFQYFDQLNFGDVPPNTLRTSVGQLWHRVMVHSDLKINSRLRFFVQLNSTFRLFNPNPITPEIDENQLSLHQAFLEYSLHKNWLIRLGRQELGYGNNRLLTFREGPNTRLAFDAAILKYKTDQRKIDLLAVTPVLSKQYAFDDTSFDDFVFGFYATEQFIPKKLIIDYYFLHFISERRKYNFISGEEKRQSFGLRLFSQQLQFNYEIEATYQTGRFSNQNILAYGISADINYKIHQKSSCTIGLTGNFFTGDHDTNDTSLNTYNLIFSKPSYGLAAPIGSSNIININPYLRIHPLKKVSVFTGIYFMHRQSSKDGTYSPGMAQVRPTPANLFASTKKEIGTQFALETNYEVSKTLSLAVDAAFFNAGDYVKETGNGRDIVYLAGKITYKF